MSGVKSISWRRLLASGLLALCAPGFAWAGGVADGVDFWTVSPPWRLAVERGSLEMDLIDDGRDGVFDRYSLLSAALIASGVENSATLARYEQWLAERTDRLLVGEMGAADVSSRARQVLQWMHQEILIDGYDASASSVATAIDQGAYNCVSGTVLFQVIAARLDLPATVIAEPRHVFSMVAAPEGPLAVETTCPDWFAHLEQGRVRPGDPNALNEPEAGEASPPMRRRLSEPALIALIYYNHGIELLAQRRYLAALSANATACDLDPQASAARANYLATLNNWAVDLSDGGEYERALEVLRFARSIAPEHDSFTANYLAICQRWADRCCAAGRYQQAVALLTAAQHELPGETYLDFVRASVVERWRNAGGPSGDGSNSP